VTIADVPTIAVIDDGPSEAIVPSKIEWGPVIGGAIAAAAMATVLHGFAAAIGLSVSSTSPTWRDASFALVLLSGLYLLLAALVSYGFGAYIAGRLRTRFGAGQASDIEFNDGLHGLLVWGLATLLAAFTALAVAQLGPRLAAPSGASPSTSVAGENIIAFDLDRLFRGDRRPAGDMNLVRAEAARILLTVSSHRGMLAEDRAHLVRLVSANTGLAAADADKRVTEVAASAKDNINRARRAGAILAFMVAAAALVGAAVAWFASTAGGRHRDGLETAPDFWSWDKPYGRA
jgi:hypothetical protein